MLGKLSKDRFHECPTCKRLICSTDWDAQSGYCVDDSPRKGDIARAQAEQAGSALKGFADAFGLGDAVKKAAEAAKQSRAAMARCPQDGALFPAGTKFCPDHGVALVQPEAQAQTQAAPRFCPNCGYETKGAKFCPNCGQQQF
jgi:RNA polymerase subunit RPABC4/transcription elongation factor Spt4